MRFRNKNTGEVKDFSPALINSALLSAQNRQRYYWANWEFGQPEDKGIVLADVIEDGGVDRDKAHCIDANYYKGGNPEQYFNKSRRQLVFNVWDNHRVKEVREDDRGFRPNRGDYKKTGISEIGRITKLDGKTDAVTTSHAPKALHAIDGKNVYYRKLTPLECERLQTLPENYSAHVSNTQRYKMIGNGWTVDVIAHIFNSI